jgi:hypothetical protein
LPARNKKKIIYFQLHGSVKKKRTLPLMFFEMKRESAIPSHVKFATGNAKDMPESEALLHAPKSMISNEMANMSSK